VSGVTEANSSKWLTLLQSPLCIACTLRVCGSVPRTSCSAGEIGQQHHVRVARGRLQLKRQLGTGHGHGR
jgi:hypothetical protein